jgi:hypothetical protein
MNIQLQKSVENDTFRTYSNLEEIAMMLTTPLMISCEGFSHDCGYHNGDGHGMGIRFGFGRLQGDGEILSELYFRFGKEDRIDG